MAEKLTVIYCPLLSRIVSRTYSGKEASDELGSTSGKGEQGVRDRLRFLYWHSRLTGLLALFYVRQQLMIQTPFGGGPEGIKKK
jgi:hypothetical protein